MKESRVSLNRIVNRNRQYVNCNLSFIERFLKFLLTKTRNWNKNDRKSIFIGSVFRKVARNEHIWVFLWSHSEIFIHGTVMLVIYSTLHVHLSYYLLKCPKMTKSNLTGRNLSVHAVYVRICLGCLGLNFVLGATFEFSPEASVKR